MNDVVTEEKTNYQRSDHIPATQAEDPITEDQDCIAQLIRNIGKDLEDVLSNVEGASQDLSQPSLLRDSACVRFFSLFSQLRDQVKKIDEAIGAEIDTASMSDGRKHEIGRLQGMVQRYLERIGAKSAPAEGKRVTLARKLWARATNIAALKKHAVTNVFVKEQVSPQTLSAWVKELEKDEQGMPKLPDELKDAIDVGDRFSVSARKA